ncbi:hypothetical protein E4U58_006012, partial [Claviceps cyperi]
MQLCSVSISEINKALDKLAESKQSMTLTEIRAKLPRQILPENAPAFLEDPPGVNREFASGHETLKVAVVGKDGKRLLATTELTTKMLDGRDNGQELLVMDLVVDLRDMGTTESARVLLIAKAN